MKCVWVWKGWPDGSQVVCCLSTIEPNLETDAQAKLEAARSEAAALCQAYYGAVAEEKAAYEQVGTIQPTADLLCHFLPAILLGAMCKLVDRKRNMP